MAHYQVILAYDGTDFEGFQRQGSTRTVQLVVENALRCLNWQGQTILASGRTDTGVHAAGQVVAFELDWEHSTEQLGRALNANLPYDVSVKSVETASADFHPRYSARARTYQYHIFSQPERHPLYDRFAWRVWPPVEFQKLRSAASLLAGTHDFAAFGMPPKEGGRTERTVYQASWEPQAGGLLFEVTANAFLYHMVRRMVYLQVRAGQNRLELERFEKAVLEAQPQIPGLAPSCGLVLWKVWYVDWQEN
ncbi:MAG: tRNA pseudouridine(38-40) synthase TruA [Anaerolineaceae bacterium]|jgi:tRNA pseudouridine38-40 synthase